MTQTSGVAQLDDYERFFAGYHVAVLDRQSAQHLDIDVGGTIVYYPRRAYDMWNTRYMIVAFDDGIDDGIATRRRAEHDSLTRKIAQPRHVRFSQTPQVELVDRGLADIHKLEAEPVGFGLGVLIDKAEMF